MVALREWERILISPFIDFPTKIQNWWQNGLKQIEPKYWIPTKHSYICSQHFAESCFVVRLGICGWRLYEHAIPSLFPSFPKYLQKAYSKRKSPQKRKFVEEPTHSEQSPSKIAKFVDSYHSYANQGVNVLEQLKKLQKEVKVLKQKINRRDKKIKSIEELITSLKKQKLILEEQHSLLEHNFSGITEDLFQNQLQNVKCTTPHGHRYSEEIKQFTMTLWYMCRMLTTIKWQWNKCNIIKYYYKM